MRRLVAILFVLFALVPAAHRTAAAGTLQLVIEPNDGVVPLVWFINSALHSLCQR